MRRFWQAISIAVFGFDTVVAVIASSLIVVCRAEATLRQFLSGVDRRVVSALELVSKKAERCPDGTHQFKRQLLITDTERDGSGLDGACSPPQHL